MNIDENYRKPTKNENESIRLFLQKILINKQIKLFAYQTTLL